MLCCIYPCKRRAAKRRRSRCRLQFLQRPFGIQNRCVLIARERPGSAVRTIGGREDPAELLRDGAIELPREGAGIIADPVEVQRSRKTVRVRRDRARAGNRPDCRVAIARSDPLLPRLALIKTEASGPHLRRAANNVLLVGGRKEGDGMAQVRLERAARDERP